MILLALVFRFVSSPDQSVRIEPASQPPALALLSDASWKRMELSAEPEMHSIMCRLSGEFMPYHIWRAFDHEPFEENPMSEGPEG
jgi:hypothetical protein